MVQKAGPAEETDEPDDALILWMLSLTPTQRLEVAQGFIDSIQALRDGESDQKPAKQKPSWPVTLIPGSHTR